VDGKPVFEIPVSDIAQATLASKTDITFEFHSDDTHNELKVRRGVSRQHRG
jgi:hypothetical protein